MDGGNWPPTRGVKSVSQCYDLCDNCQSITFDAENEWCFIRHEAFGNGVFYSEGDTTVFKGCMENGSDSFIGTVTT